MLLVWHTAHGAACLACQRACGQAKPLFEPAPSPGLQVLVDTPLAPYFSDNLTSEDLDEMNIEVGVVWCSAA